MSSPEERCAYSQMGIQAQFCHKIKCDGYRKSCFQYTTMDHIDSFVDMFEKTPLHPRVERFRRKWGETYKLNK